MTYLNKIKEFDLIEDFATLSNHWNPRVCENIRRIQVKIDRYFKRYGS